MKQPSFPEIRINRWSICFYISMLIFVGSLAFSNSLRRTLGDNRHQFPTQKSGEIFEFASRHGTVYITKTEHVIVNIVEIIQYGSLMAAPLFAFKITKIRKS
jgi:hypothetical protein